jgi:hypothetical protein
MKRLAWVAASLVLATLVASREAAGTERVVQDFEAEIAALESEYETASRAFREALKRKAESGDPSQDERTTDPTPVFHARFYDLAWRAKGTEAGGRARIWLLNHHRPSLDEPARVELRQILDELLQDHVQSGLMERLVAFLRFRTWSVGDGAAAKALQKIAAKNPEPRIQAAALVTHAELMMNPEGYMGTQGKFLEAARQLLERVKRDYADTPQAQEAERLLFELDHLQIGMVAPDFEATDENGAKWKLSDYRGKVVVLSFWGFW